MDIHAYNKYAHINEYETNIYSGIRYEYRKITTYILYIYFIRPVDVIILD